MTKPIIITSLAYKGSGQVKQLRDLAKYLQYRDGSVRREILAETGRYPDGVSDHTPPDHRPPRWVDRGLGETYSQVVNQAHQWQGRRTLARTWVISPDPELIQHVPEDRRFELVQQVTERTVERWYSDNGWGTPEYSYVLHDKHRAQDGLHMPHAHVITPGTVRVDEAGELGRIDHVVKRPHVRDLHRTAAEAFEQELGRVLGQERAQQIIAERDARLEQEQRARQQAQERRQGLKTLADVMQLIKAEQQARRAKKEKRKQKRHARQRLAELRMYARYVYEDRQQRRDADYIRRKAAQREARQQELDQARADHRQRVEHITERGRPIPTHAEHREQDEQQRRDLTAYYVTMLDRMEQRDRAPEQERER